MIANNLVLQMFLFYFRKKAANYLFLNQSFFHRMFWKIEVTAETDF